MAEHRIVAVDVFSTADADRPAASVKRMGGGKYRVQLHGQSLGLGADGRRSTEQDFDTLDEALEFADGCTYFADLDPSHMSPAAVRLQLAIDERDAEIRDLKARLGGGGG